MIASKRSRVSFRKAESASAHNSTPISRSHRVRRNTRTIFSSEQSTSDFSIMARSVPTPDAHRSGTACDPVEEEFLIALYGLAHLAGNGPQAPRVTTVTLANTASGNPLRPVIPKRSEGPYVKAAPPLPCGGVRAPFQP